jgi:hypothetical protein
LTTSAHSNTSSLEESSAIVLFPGPVPEEADADEALPTDFEEEPEEDEEEGICLADLLAPSTLTLGGAAAMFLGSYRDFLPGLSAGAEVDGLFLSIVNRVNENFRE